MDSKQVVNALMEVDPGFEQLCKTLFGDVVEPADVWDFMYEQDGLSRYLPVYKANPDQADLAPRGKFMRVIRKQAPVVKADDMDVVWSGTFSKTDEDKHQAFGWASVVEIDGKPVIDRQGDWITPDEIEKAAYQYVLENRRGGHQHRRDENDQPLQASSLIESFVVTPEKIEKMGLPSNTPVGWWVGYKVHDDEAWDKIKKGDVTGFSIHGRGKRRDVEKVEKALPLKRAAKTVTHHSTLKPVNLPGWGGDVPKSVTSRVVPTGRKKPSNALRRSTAEPQWVGEHRW